MSISWSDDLGITDDPDRFDEAVRAFRRRVPMTEEQWDKLTDEERARAFKVANVAQADLVQDVFDALASAIETGATLAEFKAEVGAQLAEAWGGESASRLESTFRTSVMSAYSEGKYEILTGDAAKESRPVWRYELIEDGRECEICGPCAGVVLPADDSFWSTNLPPQHISCRCTWTPLTDDEAAEEGGVSAKAPDVEAAEGFGRAPGVDEWEPDPSRFDSQIATELTTKLAG